MAANMTDITFVALGSLDKSHVTSLATEAAILEATGELLPPEGYIAVATTLFLIGFFGFFCNLFVIVLMCREKQLWTPMNFILFNLVCSDFSVSILGNPWTLMASVAHRWIFGRTMCVVYGFFMSLLGINSITTLTVLSFERNMMISKPFRKHQLTRQRALVAIAAIWSYSIALTAPPLFGWGDYVNESANISCSVNWESPEMSATTYIIFLFAFGLVIPVSVICYSYCNIIISLKKNTLRTGRVTKKESRVAFMILVMIIAFLVAWTPYSVLALVIAFGNPEAVSPGMAVVPALVAKSSICYNPIIYVGLNTQYRSSWRRMLGIHAKQSVTSGEVAENTILSPATQHVTEVHDEQRKLPKLFMPTKINESEESEYEVLPMKEATNLKPYMNSSGVPEPRHLDTAEINEVARPLPKSFKVSRVMVKRHGISIRATLAEVWKRQKVKEVVTMRVPDESPEDNIEMVDVNGRGFVQIVKVEDV